jgi:hypothetical protein
VDDASKNDVFAMILVDNRIVGAMGRTVSLAVPEGATNI